LAGKSKSKLSQILANNQKKNQNQTKLTTTSSSSKNNNNSLKISTKKNQ